MSVSASIFKLQRATVLCLISLTISITSGCAERDAHRVLKTNTAQAPEKAPQILAVYEPWFGDRDHIDVGYSSHDIVVLQKQVEQAKSLGLSGFVVDWYGARKPFMDKTFELMQGIAKENNFKVALMYNEYGTGASTVTEEAISALDRAYEKYISANSPNSASYLRYHGHPVIFIWPKGNTDWARVRQHVDSWADPPLLIHKDQKTKYAALFDGFYAWINPGKHGWQRDGSNWGEQYLEAFYTRMARDHSDKIVVGAAWAGFDDSRASWSENRYMDRRCGRTFEQTLHYYRRFYDDRNPLPFLLVATWNDHEEGTAIERGFTKLKPTERAVATACDTNAD